MSPNPFSQFHGSNSSWVSPSSSSPITSSSISCSNGRSIDRHSPHLKDPQREKYFHPLLSGFHPKKKKATEKPPHPISPAASSRYLLQESSGVMNEFFPEPETLSAMMVPDNAPKGEPSSTVLYPSSPSKPIDDQVVVLRVSLHCKGCEGKVRKHISKMKGVRFFSTDLATKKVTIAGDVTPLGVLTSITKVKNAQFWTSPLEK